MRFAADIAAWPDLTRAFHEGATRISAMTTHSIAVSFLMLSMAQLATFFATFGQAQMLGKGVFEHHTNTYCTFTVAAYDAAGNTSAQSVPVKAKTLP